LTKADEFPRGLAGFSKVRTYPQNKTKKKWAANVEKPTYYPQSVIVRNYLGGTVVEGTIILKWISRIFDMGVG